MTAEILSVGSGIQAVNSNVISWEHEFIGPAAAGTALMVFVGGVDSGTPSIVSAVFSGTAVSPISEKVLSTAVSITGPGGQSFPCGWILWFASPASETGTVTGTVAVSFDEQVGRMNGSSAIISGTTGILDGSPTSTVKNTQSPDFNISNTLTPSASGSIIVDMCVSESSNHNAHAIINDQTKFSSLFFTGPKITTSFKESVSADPVEMTRSGVGGPFAGVSLLIVGLAGN